MPYSNIDKPSKYFTAKTYTANASTQNITGLEFKPDFVWTKSRANAYNHNNYDVIRGATVNFGVNQTRAEGTDLNSLTSFNSDGFTLGYNEDSNYTNGSTAVSWNWLAGGTGVSNTAGTISSTVSANTTSGFSIVSYTGTSANATVGHGLGVAPKMVIIKGRDTTYDWVVWFSGFSTTQRLLLNTTDAISTGGWNTLPTSSVFGLGTHLNINESTKTYIAYCFAEVKGYSKFGSYTGNASSSGTFVYTGFKPAFVLIKPTSSIDNWWIIDNKRDGYNKQYKLIVVNSQNAEDTANAGVTDMDLLSNGFRLTTNWSGWNNSGQTVMYACFAESPFVSSKGIPTTAR